MGWECPVLKTAQYTLGTAAGDVHEVVIESDGTQGLRVGPGAKVGVGEATLNAPLNLPHDSNGLVVDLQDAEGTSRWNIFQVDTTVRGVTVIDPQQPKQPPPSRLTTMPGALSIGSPIDEDGVRSTFLTILDNGNVGIGTTTPSGNLHVYGTSANYFDRIDSNNGAHLLLRSAGGNIDQETALKSGAFGCLDFSGFDGSAWTIDGAQVHGIATQNWSPVQHGSALSFLTVANTESTATAPATAVEVMRIDSSGNVGIGTTLPASPLHVADHVTVGLFPSRTVAAQGRLEVSGPSAELGFIKRELTAFPANPAPGDRFVWYNSLGIARLWTEVSGDLVAVTGAGHVGIGTTTPENAEGWQKVLDIAGGTNAKLSVRTGNIDARMLAHENGWWGSPAGMVIGTKSAHSLSLATSSTTRMTVDGAGNVGIGTTTPEHALHVIGDLMVTGDVLLKGADCAEDFDVVGKPPEPGAVVVITNDGALRESEKAYDKRVAGVVSGAGEYRPGILLDRRCSPDSRVPVALAGKVCCKVDAGYGAIEVGDLLTTSPSRGCAMKALEQHKAFGAVLGKALASLESWQGIIPVLVALQ